MQQTVLRRGLSLMVAVAAVGLLVWAGLALALSGPQSTVQAAAPGSGAAGPGAPRLTSLVLSTAPGAPPTRPQNAPPAFSTSTDNQLYAHMVWANVGGTYDAYLTFRSPDGAIYQVLDVPFTTGPAPAGANTLTQQRPGVLHPVTVQVATLTAGGGYQVVGALPIAGTWVSRLLGTWKLEVRLGTDPTVLGGQAFTFTR